MVGLGLCVGCFMPCKLIPAYTLVIAVFPGTFVWFCARVAELMLLKVRNFFKCFTSPLYVTSELFFFYCPFWILASFRIPRSRNSPEKKGVPLNIPPTTEVETQNEPHHHKRKGKNEANTFSDQTQI